MIAQEQIGIDQTAAQRAAGKAERKQRFKEGAQATGKKLRSAPRPEFGTPGSGKGARSA
jgi:hypothetical protein